VYRLHSSVLDFKKFTEFNNLNNYWPLEGYIPRSLLIHKHFLCFLITRQQQWNVRLAVLFTLSTVCRTPTILFHERQASRGKLLVSPMSVGWRGGSEIGGGSSEVASGVAGFRHRTLIKQLTAFQGGVARIYTCSHPVCYSDIYNTNVTISS
jgi:hypothetical protein